MSEHSLEVWSELLHKIDTLTCSYELQRVYFAFVIAKEMTPYIGDTYVLPILLRASQSFLIAIPPMSLLVYDMADNPLLSHPIGVLGLGRYEIKDFSRAESFSHGCWTEDEYFRVLSRFRIDVLDMILCFNPFVAPEHDDLVHAILPPLMKAIVFDIINGGDESAGKSGLRLLIDFVDQWPENNIMPHLVRLNGYMLRIAVTDSLGQGTRHLAMDYVISVAAAAGQELPWNILDKFVKILMCKLLNVNHRSFSFNFAKDCLGRLAEALDGHVVIFSVVFDRAKEYLDDQDAQKRFAGLVSIAQMADDCSEVIINDTLEQVLCIVLKSLLDVDPHVRCGAFDTIGTLATGLAPNLQNLYHERVIRALVTGVMVDDGNSQVKAHAVPVIRDFIESCNAGVIEGCLNELADQLRHCGVILP